MSRELTPTGARKTKIRALPVTTASVPFDLSVVATEVWGDVSDANFLRMRADGCDVYYAFDVATGTIDKTMTTAANITQCDVIPSGQYIDIIPPYVPNGQAAGTGICNWLMIQGSAAGFLRLSLSSESPKQRY